MLSQKNPNSHDPQEPAPDSFVQSFREERPRLWRLIRFRLHPSVRQRVDSDDILQDVFIEASKRYDAFLAADYSSAYLWLRQVALQTLQNVHRFHIGTQQRSTNREVYSDLSVNDAASHPLTRLVAAVTSPSSVAMRQEVKVLVDNALQQLSENDWEVIQLRQFEELTNAEVADVLQISGTAASIRYVRALGRLRDIVESMPGFTAIDREGTRS